MSTKHIRDVVNLMLQWDARGQASDAAYELGRIRRAARALVAAGLDWRPGDSGEFIEAVKIMRKIAEEEPR